MTSTQPSRIAAARSRAAVAKQTLAVGAAALFGFLVLFLRAGGGHATRSSSSWQTPPGNTQPASGSLGGGSVAQPPQGGGIPQAQTGTS
jgi:hypothetical protein